MTGSAERESKSPSRRAMLAGVLGGIGAWAATAIGSARPVRAGVDGDVVLGSPNNVATTATVITNTANDNTVFLGDTNTGIGILGRSSTNFGVAGSSISDIGVYGSTDAADRPGTVGWSRGSGTGLLGFSSQPNVLHDARAKTGVYGYAAQDASAVGVVGESVDGIGVLGLATGGGTAALGLFARSNSADAPAIGARSAGDSTGIVAKSGGGSFPSPKAKTGAYGYAAQDSGSKGVWGTSPAGHGIHGESSSGWAGYFDGRLLVKKYMELVEIGTPTAPGSNHARLFIRDNGSGKTQLCVRFHTGVVKVLATQP
jgi:hypothetical protein